MVWQYSEHVIERMNIYAWSDCANHDFKIPPWSKSKNISKYILGYFWKIFEKWLPKICNWVFRVELSLHRACWCHVYHQISCSDPCTWRVHILTSALNGRHWATKISKWVFLKLNVCILIPNSLEFISIDQITLFMLRLGPIITRTNAHHVFQLDMA